ncbi:MAG: peptidylprolyl isomerase [Bradymonadaceae bacterium]|nr:peptidylprolyl isomerase [Lujinxingiaceae bacterium]
MSKTTLILIIAALSALGLGCDSKNRGQSQTPATSDQQNGAAQTPSPRHASTPAPAAFDEARTADEPPEQGALLRYTADLKGSGALVASIQTSLGIIRCELEEERAPRTVANFVGLARGQKAWLEPSSQTAVTGKPYFDGTIFHRVIPDFMIQGGDPTGTGFGGPGYEIADEFHPELRHRGEGILSMANRGPNTGGSQFFITQATAPHLDERHSVFGRCSSPDVIKAIARVPSDARNRPISPPVIEAITFVRATK